MATILIVDDEPGIRAFMADTLADAGHTIMEAAGGEGALEHLHASAVDLVFLDLRMPGALGGIDVLRRVRASWPGIPVVVLTAHGSVDVAVEAMHLGAADFLQKPLDGPGELRRLATRTLNRFVVAPPPPAPEGRAADPAAAGGGQPRISGRLPRVDRLLAELRRRRVYNVAATYIAAGFVALQVAQLLLPGLPLPGWTYTVLVSVAIVGFPVVLVLGWVFDLTLTRTPAAKARAVFPS